MRRGTWAFSRGATGKSDLHSCCEELLGVPFESVLGNQAYLELRGNSMTFCLVAGTEGFLSSFDR